PRNGDRALLHVTQRSVGGPCGAHAHRQGVHGGEAVGGRTGCVGGFGLSARGDRRFILSRIGGEGSFALFAAQNDVHKCRSTFTAPPNPSRSDSASSTMSCSTRPCCAR